MMISARARERVMKVMEVMEVMYVMKARTREMHV
jgi:hypothetical protein